MDSITTRVDQHLSAGNKNMERHQLVLMNIIKILGKTTGMNSCKNHTITTSMQVDVLVTTIFAFILNKGWADVLLLEN